MALLDLPKASVTMNPTFMNKWFDLKKIIIVWFLQIACNRSLDNVALIFYAASYALVIMLCTGVLLINYSY